MTDTQNPISMTTTHNSCTDHFSPIIPPSNVKKTHRVSFARSEPERPAAVPKTNIKSTDHLTTSNVDVPNEDNQSDHQVGTTTSSSAAGVADDHGDQELSGRERLKRHRVEVAGRVWIPDIWGQEDLLKDWIDCTVFDASLGNNTIMSARAALVGEGRSTNSGILRIENRC